MSGTPVKDSLLELIKPASMGGASYVAKSTDHYTRWKELNLIKTKNEAITSLCQFVQDLAIPNGLRVEKLRSDKGGEYIAGYYQKYCI